MREYTVTKEILNIRNKPSDESDDTYIGCLLKGDTVWLDETEIPGSIPKGGTTDVWLRHNGDNVVAKDGVRLKSYADKVNEFVNDKSMTYLHNNSYTEEDWKVSWAHVDLEIWKIWRDYKTMGEGVKVAVIDTGVYDIDNDLKNRARIKRFYGYDSANDTTPYHGTKSAGVIGAGGEFVKRVFGVAPKCELYIYKAGSDDSFSPGAIEHAIKGAINDKVDIISMSFHFDSDVQFLGQYISLASKNNILLFASSGDAGITTKTYPASYPECFSVGAYFLDDSNNRKVFVGHSNHNDSLSFIGPGKDILTTSNLQIDKHQSTSASCAFIAGVFALIRSKNSSLNYNLLIKNLNKGMLTDSIEKTELKNDFEGYGVPIIDKLINLK